MRSLPSLNGLRAFEVAARLGSFTATGKELNVTPAAVSRHVRLLEERLGLALFERQANRLVLTSAGRTYQAGLTPIFDGLADLTTRVVSIAATGVLTIGVGPTFAVRWLIPRLAEFQKIAPDVELRFATGGATAPFRNDWTCGIELGAGSSIDSRQGVVSELLFNGDLIPVCTPDIAARLKTPGNLKNETLLRVAHASGDWALWSETNGYMPLEEKGPVFEYYAQAIQAAMDGVGVAMGITPYIYDDIKAGRLITPFPSAVSKGKAWYLIYREDRAIDPAFHTFRNWLMNQAHAPA